jgi:hypothetical protein
VRYSSSEHDGVQSGGEALDRERQQGQGDGVGHGHHGDAVGAQEPSDLQAVVARLDPDEARHVGVAAHHPARRRLRGARVPGLLDQLPERDEAVERDHAPQHRLVDDRAVTPAPRDDPVLGEALQCRTDRRAADAHVAGEALLPRQLAVGEHVGAHRLEQVLTHAMRQAAVGHGSS